MNFAEIIVVGNLVSDAQLSPAIIEKGEVTRQARLTFHCAVNWHFKPQGEGDHSNFRCTLWGNRAEKLAPYMKVGKEVLVKGLPMLYKVGEVPQTDGNTKTAMGLNINVRDISLGSDSMKQRGSVVSPANEALLKLLVNKGIISAEEIAGALGTPQEQAAEEGPAQEAAETDDTPEQPFGDQ